MIRQALRSGLLAAVAVVAVLPAAGAAPASAATAPRQAPAAVATTQTVRTPHHTLPVHGVVATSRARLNIRSGPGTGYRVVGHVRANRSLTLACKAYGSGVYGNHIWYRLRHHRHAYVAAHYIRTARSVPWC
ncbi:SH3 domain-containing protein [Streptomyces sp. J2-1]|uniref:SH3 domain-containing protein n=1 Tax=Streptomyces corallincola TaxID=2851888 RepID=UPI001C38D223|nr:SH3 domain-containing protein [Streptomyces corallincola]MBV2356226.1 SH3 domain-containing protein [Streptomyces corallincola]